MFQLRHRVQNTEGEGGGGGTDFQTLIPTEYRNHPSLAPIKDIPNLVKSFVNAQEMIGKNKIVVPGENAKPEEWNEFFSKLGRPDAPDKYGLKKPSDLPEGFDIEDQLIGQLGQMFHAAGLTQRQAQVLFDKYNSYAKNEFTNATKEAQLRSAEELAALKREWGAAYDAKIDSAKRAIRAFLGESEAKWLDDNGLSGNPKMLRIFASVGEKLSEPSADGGGGQGGGFGPITPAAAQAEINQKMSDPDFVGMYFNKDHPRHKWAVEQMLRLHTFAFPEKKSA
jgi:hypothetical protein